MYIYIIIIIFLFYNTYPLGLLKIAEPTLTFTFAFFLDRLFFFLIFFFSETLSSIESSPIYPSVTNSAPLLINSLLLSSYENSCHLNNNNNKLSTDQIKKDLINTYSNVLIEEYQQRVNHKPMRHRPSKDCEHIQNELFNFNCDVSDVHG